MNITLPRAVIEKTLEALDAMNPYPASKEDQRNKAITALRAALGQPEPEPVAWKDKTYGNLHHQDFGNSIPLYTAPPQRKPLSDEEIGAILEDPNIAEKHQGNWLVLPYAYARAIEAAHNIKGDA